MSSRLNPGRAALPSREPQYMTQSLTAAPAQHT